MMTKVGFIQTASAKCNIKILTTTILLLSHPVTQAQFFTLGGNEPVTTSTHVRQFAANNEDESRTYQADSIKRTYIIDSRKGFMSPDSLSHDTLTAHNAELSAKLAAYMIMSDSLMLDFVKRSAQIRNSALSAAPTNQNYNPSNVSLSMYYPANKDGHTLDSIDLTIPNLFRIIVKEHLKFPIIVLAQAIHETGWFSSTVCHRDNNLFGLTQSWDGKYYKFRHWTESVKAYRDKVQYKYKGGDYFEFLDKLGYAEDPLYIQKVKRIIDQYLTVPTH